MSLKLEELEVGMYLTYNDGVVQCVDRVTSVTKHTFSTITVEGSDNVYGHKEGFERTLNQKSHVDAHLSYFYTLNHEYAIKKDIKEWLDSE